MEIFIPNNVASTLSFIEDGKSYWVHISCSAIMSIKGPDMFTDIYLSKYSKPPSGWNLIGFTSTKPIMRSIYLSGLNYYGLWTFENSQFSVVNPHDLMIPGKGYYTYIWR